MSSRYYFWALKFVSCYDGVSRLASAMWYRLLGEPCGLEDGLESIEVLAWFSGSLVASLEVNGSRN